MEKSIKKTILLAVVAALLVAYVVFVEFIPHPEARNGVIFDKIEVEEIVKVEIENEFGHFALVNSHPYKIAENREADLELTDDNLNDWYLENAPAAPLDKEALTKLLHSILQIRVRDPFTPQEDLSVYGLNNPGLILKITTLNAQHVIEIGDKSDFIGSLFARLDEDKLFMVSNDILRAGLKPAAAFRNAYIVPLTYDDILALKIIRDDNELHLKKDGEKWNIYQPDFFEGDQENIKMLIASVLALSSKTYFDIDKVPLQSIGLEFPAMIIEIQSKQGLKRLLFTAPPAFASEENLYVYMIGASYFSELDRYRIGKFPLSLYALRRKEFISVNPEDVVSFTINKRGLLPTYVEKVGNNWLVNGGEGDTPFIENYLKSLNNIMAVDFPNFGESVDFKEPLFKLSLKSKDGSEKIILVAQQVKLDDDDNKQLFFVMGSDTNEPYLITANIFRQLAPNAETLSKVVVREE